MSAGQTIENLHEEPLFCGLRGRRWYYLNRQLTSVHMVPIAEPAIRVVMS